MSQPSAFSLSFNFSKAIKNANLTEAKQIFVKMREQETDSDTDKYIINYANTVLKIWDGNISGAVSGYYQRSTSPLILIGALQEYFSNAHQHLGVKDATRLHNELKELSNFFYKRNYDGKPTNHYLDLVLSSVNGCWELKYFQDNQYLYRYHGESNQGLNDERPNFFISELFNTKEEARNKLAIDKDWNDMNYISVYQVRAPFFLLSGIINKSGNLTGGATQYLVPRASMPTIISTNIM
jgi:hypothetical protein